MTPVNNMSKEEKLEWLRLIALKALEKFGLPSESEVVLANHSENTTFRISRPHSGEQFALRVHRQDYHSRKAIESELVWMSALRNEAGVVTPVAVRGTDGEWIQNVYAPETSDTRYCVLFHWMKGRVPDEEHLTEPFFRLGKVAGHIHAHSCSWNLPDDFQRDRWDFDAMLGLKPIFGRWEEGPGLTGERTALLSDLASMIRVRLETFGKSSKRFGLIHADLRLANLLVHKGETRVIDFDDCGFGWYLYDLATAMSFIEERSDISELISSWGEGYQRVLPLAEEDVTEIPTFLMLRRLVILGWIASHAETDLAHELGADYTAGTCRLAQKYLDSFR